MPMSAEEREMVMAVAGLSAKMDTALDSLTEVKNTIKNLPQRHEVEALDKKIETKASKEDVTRLEKTAKEDRERLEKRMDDYERDRKGMFFKWAPIVFSAIGVAIAVSTFFRASPQPAITQQNQVQSVQTK